MSKKKEAISNANFSLINYSLSLYIIINTGPCQKKKLNKPLLTWYVHLNRNEYWKMHNLCLIRLLEVFICSFIYLFVCVCVYIALFLKQKCIHLNSEIVIKLLISNFLKFLFFIYFCMSVFILNFFFIKKVSIEIPNLLLNS